MKAPAIIARAYAKYPHTLAACAGAAAGAILWKLFIWLLWQLFYAGFTM